MRVLGIETSCDETGIAIYDSEQGLLAHRVHSQIALHAEYGGVVPELASRDHVRKVLPLLRELFQDTGIEPGAIDGVPYTAGPGLVGALLVGAAVGLMGAGLIITGGAPLRGAQIESRGDHRIAMSAALLGLLAEGESQIEGAEAVDTSFPGFVALLRSLGADITEETL